MGNFSSCEAAELLGALRCAASERCQLLLGADAWKDAGVLAQAYNDTQGEAPGESEELRGERLRFGAAPTLPCSSADYLPGAWLPDPALLCCLP